MVLSLYIQDHGYLFKMSFMLVGEVLELLYSILDEILTHIFFNFVLETYIFC